MFAQQLILDFEGRSTVGIRPFALFESKDGAWHWHVRDSSFPFRDGHGDVVAEMRRALQWCESQGISSGAAIGFWGYDFARRLEPRAFQKSGPDDLRIPDIRLEFCEEIKVSDNTIELENLSYQPVSLQEMPAPPVEYLSAIERIQDYITRGDIYQANFTQRFAAPLPVAPSNLYKRLRQAHLTPFSALLEWDDLAILSNSPERFVRLCDRQLLTQPIKGTIRRGANANEDKRLREELQASVKDRAENVMIVDLLRNDLGRVCEWGTVKVPSLWEVQSFPTLHHLVSTVTGTLRTDRDALDALTALFPCGSITGAPKIRAMQILDELEPVRRGVSMGAIGYLDFQGGMEWNVAIRTMTCQDGMVYWHTGGGIVADSVPVEEWRELQLKARAIQTALLDAS